MEAGHPFKTPVNFYQTTWRHILEDITWILFGKFYTVWSIFNTHNVSGLGSIQPPPTLAVDKAQVSYSKSSESRSNI
jgi:hypothetical protein